MGRQARVEYAGAMYHLMCRGNRRADIFENDNDRMVFLDTLAEVCERTGWRVCAYVLMSNHYHMVVHGKGSLFGRMPGCEREKIAQLRLLYAYMYAHPGAKLLFMGAELGQPCEWDFQSQLNWELQGVAGHSELGRYLAVLNDLYRGETLFWRGECSGEGFEWLEAPQDGLLFFARHGAADAELALCLFNPSRSGVQTCRLTPPTPGEYRVVLNSDDSLFKGSGSGPRRGSSLSPDGSGELVFELAPLSAIILLRNCSGE